MEIINVVCKNVVKITMGNNFRSWLWAISTAITAILGFNPVLSKLGKDFKPSPLLSSVVESNPICNFPKIADVPNVPDGPFYYGGSTTFAPLRSHAIEIDKVIQKNFLKFELRHHNPIRKNPGSGEGIKKLLDGQLSFAESSRPIKDEESQQAQRQNFKLESIPVAIDAITFYVNPQLIVQGGLKGITLAQAEDILLGKIKNWKDVNGPDVAITPFSRDQDVGGTVDFISEELLKKQNFGANVRKVNDTTDSIRQVAKTPGGIGFATVSEIINQQTIRILPLAKAKEVNTTFISPCGDENCTDINTTIIKDNYPLTRRLFVVIKRNGQSYDEQAGVAYSCMLLS
ncbi:MAG: PstS family phosphate ABC transporter substrate-binding protein, partial [Hassallia sp.]